MSYRYLPTAPVAEWFHAAGYALSDDSDEIYGIAWGRNSGYGYLTLEWFPHSYGWDAIVSVSGEARRTRVSITQCRTLAEMRRLHELFASFEWDESRQRYGEDGYRPEQLTTTEKRP